MRPSVIMLRWLATSLLAAAAAAQTRIPTGVEQPDLFLAAWLTEQLDRDAPAAIELYRQAEETDLEHVKGAGASHVVRELAQAGTPCHGNRDQAGVFGDTRVRRATPEGSPDGTPGRLVDQLRSEDAGDHDDGIAIGSVVHGVAVVEPAEVRNPYRGRAATDKEEQQNARTASRTRGHAFHLPGW